MSLPTLAGGRAPMGGPPPAPLNMKDIGEAIRQEIINLKSQDTGVASRAAAQIFLIAAQRESEPYLKPAIPPLVSLLSSSDIYCQRNACGALTSIMGAGNSLYTNIISSHGLGPALVCALGSEDAGLRLNSASSLSTLAQGREGLELVNAAGADEVLIKILQSDEDDAILEASADAVCALCADVANRESLIRKGIFGPLVRILERNAEEPKVRSLLAVGMLTGTSFEAQSELAKTNGAIKSLMKLTRSSDGDVQAIASDIFGALARNKSLRNILKESMKEEKE